MKTAIYGGTFNPPHIGHESVVRFLSETLKPDRILIVPTFLPPMKVQEEGSPSPEERLRLATLAFQSIPRTEVSDIELRRKGTSYTIDTLLEIRNEAPEDLLFLTIGSDQLLSFRKWRRFQEILELATLIVFSREDGADEAIEREAATLERTYGARVIIMEKEPLPISSSEIRRAIRGELPMELAETYVHPDVLREIRTRNAYRAK